MASPLVQEISGSTTGTSLTLTLPAATTSGNAVIIAVSGFRGSTISNITLGGTGSIFTKVSGTGSTTENAQIWEYTPVTINSTAIVITAGAAGIIAWAYEVNGYAPYLNTEQTGFSVVTPDQLVNAYATTGTSWSSGTTSPSIPAAEFIVGIGGTTGTSSTTITGPSTGGWTNETAYSGVHAGSYYYGGVSGYQIQSGASGTYSYAGTTSASTGSGAVTATFLCMPEYDNWGGYTFFEHPSYTSVSATFTVPSLSGETGAECSIWVGLGDVYQTGIFINYDTGQTGNVGCVAWSWWVPGGGEIWDPTAYPVQSGDSLTCTVQVNNSDWLMTITSNTQGWTYTEVKSTLAVNIGQLASAPSGPAVWPYPPASANVIVEDEGTLPDYGTVAFTNITTTPAISVTPVPIATLNTDIDQYPGPFTLTGATGSFMMYWNGYT